VFGRDDDCEGQLWLLIDMWRRSYLCGSIPEIRSRVLFVVGPVGLVGLDASLAGLDGVLSLTLVCDHTPK